MNILHINDYHASGGAEVVFNNIYNELGGKKIVLNDYISNKKILRTLQMFFLNLKLVFILRLLLKNNNYDAILLHNYNLSPFSIYLGIYKHINIIQVVHSCGQLGCVSSWGVYRINYSECNVIPKYKKCKKKCAYDKNIYLFSIYYFYIKIVVFFRKKVIKNFISPSYALSMKMKNNNFKKIHVLNNYINSDKKESKKYIKKNIILYVGQINKLKGVGSFLDAWNKIYNKVDIKNWEVVIVGGGPELEKLRKIYINKNVKFIGKINHQEVKKYYENSKILIVPSLWYENYPTVCLEGLLNDCVVIGSNRGGIVEIIGKEYTFNVLDKVDIQLKIQDTIQNYDLYKEQSIKYKNKILLNTKNKYFLEYFKILKNEK